jgi:hypothetical protein
MAHNYNEGMDTTQQGAMMDINYRDDIRAALDLFLIGIPGVKGGKSFGYPAYKVNGKIFCWVTGDGISLKLGEKRVAELIAEHPHMSIMEVVEGTHWKAWVSIRGVPPEEYEHYLPLFEEAMSFVAGG